ncbi:MAG: RluA family pseudouridine synthase [Candidatus Peribacteraceae bacterium]|nr:RluA family pseudouridine synthase [Candidatus Peribacteraceae bacterium]
MPTWTADKSRRLDLFIASMEAEVTRARAQKLIERRAVSVNGKLITRSAHVVRVGDTVEVADVPLESNTVIAPVDLKLEVLYEDKTCFVVAKPPDLSVHPGAGMAPDAVTLLSGIAWLYKKWKIPFSSGHCLVHRLDKDTSGCLLVAKTPEAHLALQKQFEERSVQKTYLALVAGVPKQEAALIDAPMGRHGQSRTRMAVIGASKTREAQTSYRVLSSGKDASLLEVALHTGRTHQARVHLRAINHPIVGDPAYHTDTSIRLSRTLEAPRVCLHAWKLTFTPPNAKKPVTVSAPLPADIGGMLAKVGLPQPE